MTTLPAATSGATRVLIVDDREDSRYFLESLFRANGFEPTIAHHGGEALELAKEHPPQLIVSDLLMPVMDGYRLLRRWRAEPGLRDIPFVVYTATYTDPKDEQFALDLGADAFVLKPAEPDQLLQRIREVLSHARGASAPRAQASPVEEDEAKTLQQYSEVLIHKLEDKMEEVDRTKRQLERDIVRREETEARLREKERKYRELVEHANTIILRWTRDGRIIFLNEFGQRFFGYGESEILNRHIVGTIVSETESTGRDLRPLMQRIAANPKAFEQNVNENTCRDGRRVWIAWTNRAVLDDQGEVAEVLSIGSDITERKQLEEQFRQSQKLEAIGQLAAGVAHDFNNILTVIEGNASLLLDMPGRPAEETEPTKQILAAAERAAQLTRQLLLFSRKQNMQRARVSLSRVVDNLSLLLRRTLGVRIALRTEYAAGLPPIDADPTMIEQVVLNLAINARDAMPDGGKLDIDASVEAIDADCAQRNPDATPGNYVRLSVSDTGCGISPENLPRIFDPFFTTKEVGKGTGLGLAIVYGVVKQHGGWVDVTSAVGRGSTFRIYLPAMAAEPSERAQAASHSQTPGGQEVILVVEDEMGVRLLANNLLQRCGYTVFSAASGVAALEIWRQHKARIQLLFTDMIMPDGLMGRELADRLKTEKPELRVIYTTGYSADVAANSGALVEGVNFLQKPYSLLKLAQTVRKRLDGPL